MTYRFPARPRFIAFAATSVAAFLGIAAAGATTAQASPAASANKGWRVIRTIGPDNTILENVVAFSHSPEWLGGEALSTKGQFYAVVYHFVSGQLHQVALTTQLGTGVNGLSATSPTNVWASVEVLGGQVDRLTKHGWHPYSFKIGSDDILVSPVVTTGPKNTWELDEDFTTKIDYAYHFNGSKWHRQVIPAAPDANSLVGYVSASAANNIWALTFYKNKAATLRYNGRKWQIIPFPSKLAPAGLTLEPQQILALSPKNVWATTNAQGTSGLGPLILLHWNGRRWYKITGGLPKQSLLGPIASDGSGGLWLEAVNHAETVASILHYSKGHWGTFKIPADNGKRIGIEAMTLIPGTHSVIGTAVIAGSGESTDGTAVVKYGP